MSKTFEATGDYYRIDASTFQEPGRLVRHVRVEIQIQELRLNEQPDLVLGAAAEAARDAVLHVVKADL
ncbi:MAG: hypothetical protein V3W32_06875 [Gemmatimonadota bacterium]